MSVCQYVGNGIALGEAVHSENFPALMTTKNFPVLSDN
jgi:hypothetical protein